MSDWKAKRFWKKAQVTDEVGGYGVALDARPVNTPGKLRLIVPTRAMAEAIAAEWDAQEEHINPNTMPVTRSANSALEKVGVQHGAVADMIADYGDSDLLCYRATSPQELVARQAAGWDPLLAWADSELDVRLAVHPGVMHQSQNPEMLQKLRTEVHAQDNFALTALHDLVSLSGSLIIGLAAQRESQPIETLWKLSRIDEDWQTELWGEDDDANAQTARKAEAFLHAKRFFDLSRVADHGHLVS
ncbi:ATPase [Pseudohalocynthiibacter aestuariivivens]|uniref:ATPase n=1 Tax=Roseovarius pelagicus TaxID=2980108 RepID=A0ABY6DFH0_9RHOB|nr:MULTISPECIES: ATP12 family protein [Rhodobacterales]QIE46662.1 ATPase [Pseudohalocynthiibacter aestuariivivens]UXX84805.1 ATPase [Roseovarius pelagicus]